MASSDLARQTAQELAHWNGHASIYTDIYILKDQHDATSQAVIAAVNKHKPAEGALLLDLASSAGRPALPLAKAFPQVHVVSTDIAPIFVSLAANRAQAEGVPNFKAEVADAQDLAALADNSIAVVTFVYGLVYTPNYKKVLREAYRVLQPGGLFVVAEFGPPPKAEKLQLFMGLLIALGGDPSMMHISGLADSSQVPNLLQEAQFLNVTTSEYTNNLSFEEQDLAAMLIGPHGHFMPLLERLQAAGKAGVHQAAPQVLQDLCKQRGWTRDGTVHLQNTALLFSGVKA